MLWVIVPALDESENLQILVPMIEAELVGMSPGSKVLVVDDGSSDGTSGVVEAMAQRSDRVGLLTLGRNFGKATALQRGFEVALSAGAQHVAMMDADGQDDPKELPRLVDHLLSGADLVTGARRQRNDRLVKRQTSKVYNWATAKMSGVPGKDFNSGFKVMRAEVAQSVSPMLYGELHRYLTVIAHWLGYRVAEVEVAHHARMHGVSKYGIARFWRGFVDLLTVRFLMSYESRPSHLFGGLGLVSLALGSVCLVYLTALKILGNSIGDRPLLIAGVLMVMVGLQLFLFGLLAELTIYRSNNPKRRTSP